MYPMPVPPMQPVYKQTNHAVHLILSLITLGLWLFVWPFVAVANSANNKHKREQYQYELTQYTQAMQVYQQQQRW